MKKYNLDGPGGIEFYWHDTRKEKRVFSRRQAGGGGVMVWVLFNARCVGASIFEWSTELKVLHTDIEEIFTTISEQYES